MKTNEGQFPDEENFEIFFIQSFFIIHLKTQFHLTRPALNRLLYRVAQQLLFNPSNQMRFPEKGRHLISCSPDEKIESRGFESHRWRFRKVTY